MSRKPQFSICGGREFALSLDNGAWLSSREAVETPDHYHVKGATAGVCHQSIEAWAAFLATAGAIGIHASDRPSSLCDQLS